MSTWVSAALICFAVGAAVSAATIERSIAKAPEALVRSNFRNLQLPAVLGTPLGAGAVASCLASWALAQTSDGALVTAGPPLAVALLVGALGIAGAWDDHRGDERPRGFSGHLGAARAGVLTGGIVKAAAGLLAGLLAGFIVAHGWAIATTAILVALGANLLNLLDRAPGRALKVGLTTAGCLMVWGSSWWLPPGAGVTGAAAAVLWPDLRERAMLGDAGANPFGGVLGLGLAMSLSFTFQIVAACILLAANLASEMWSFSKIIDAVAPLRAFDRLGRRP